jgi:spermidine dehydrogenase
MNNRDKRLGMDRDITRRDFLSGVSVAIGASLLPACTKSGAPRTDVPHAYYPPAETGMRGAHPGSFEVAHAAVKGESWEAKRSGERYDLIIVGAGISGLSAAYIYHRDVDADARILILDNHDDFGGHAKRNEFTLDGRTFIGYGGTMLIESPGGYPDVAKQLIRELGIEIERAGEFGLVNYSDIYETSRGTFFDKETFGADYLATGRFGFSGSLDDAPLSESAKKELEHLFADKKDYLPGMTPAERRAVLESHTWREYLEKYTGVGEEVLTFVQKWSHGVWAIGADALPAWMATLVLRAWTSASRMRAVAMKPGSASRTATLRLRAFWYAS